MTREEAIEYFKIYRKIFCEDHLKICPKDSIAYQATLKEKEFYDMAIKALDEEEKEFAYADFDEYNNEILGFDDTDIYDRDSCTIGLGRALQIINKHISGKEQE